MLRPRFVFLVALLALAAPPLFPQDGPKPAVKRDAQAVEILTRTVNAAGGLRSLSAVRDITESGEITFYWGEGVKGPVGIRSLGGSRFRMDADLPQGKSTWLLRDGDGTRKEAGNERRISAENALNLGNLTFPLAHIAAALTDTATDVSFVGIEKRNGRSVYRLRLKGQLGLTSKRWALSIVKDLLIDALTFDIVGVGDHPYPTYDRGGKPSDIAPREIDFSDFRVVSGVRVPFSISAKLQGQLTMSILLSEIAFNSNLSDTDFRN